MTLQAASAERASRFDCLSTLLPVWLLVALRRSVVMCALGGLAVWAHAHQAAPSGSFAGPIDLDHAQRHAVDIEDGAWEPVLLPDDWHISGRSGRWTYRIGFQGVPAASPVMGLLLPRAGNRYMVELNGWPIATEGLGEGSTADHGARPALYILPSAALRTDSNELLITVAGERGRGAGLAAPSVGAHADLESRHRHLMATRVWSEAAGAVVSAVFAVVAGITACFVNCGSVRRYALACGLCAFTYASSLFDEAPMDWRMWALLVGVAQLGYLVCIAQFTARSLALGDNRLDPACRILCLLGAVLLPIVSFGRSIDAMHAWALIRIGFLIVCCVAMRGAFRSPRRIGAVVLLLAGIVSLALEGSDYVALYIIGDRLSSPALAHHGVIAFQLAACWILIDWYQTLKQEAADARHKVELEASVQRLELLRQFDVRRAIESERAEQSARRAILTDLHDGLGLQLHGLLTQVERAGAPDRRQLTHEVRTAIEQMRMIVEGTESLEGDLGMLLAQIRHVVARRLRAADIGLEWTVSLAEEGRNTSSTVGLALQRTLFELTTNVIRHAHARRVKVSIVDGPLDLQIAFEDDGRGFEPAGVHFGTGVRSIQRRAVEIGGEVRLDARAGNGVRIHLILPWRDDLLLARG